VNGTGSLGDGPAGAHDQCMELAIQALDFDLEEEALAGLVRHLEACPSCSAAASAYRLDALALESLVRVPRRAVSLRWRLLAAGLGLAAASALWLGLRAAGILS
jgi:hypothetical protein